MCWGHPPSRAEHDAESLPDHGHERRLGDEEVVGIREFASLPLVARVLFDFLRLDDQIRSASRLQGELSRREDGHANRLPASLREDHVLLDPVLWDGHVHIPQVQGDLDGLVKFPRLRGLEEFLDCLHGMLVRQGISPPAVRAAGPASCKGNATKGRGLNKVSGRRAPLTSGTAFGDAGAQKKGTDDLDDDAADCESRIIIPAMITHAIL